MSDFIITIIVKLSIFGIFAGLTYVTESNKKFYSFCYGFLAADMLSSPLLEAFLDGLLGR